MDRGELDMPGKVGLFARIKAVLKRIASKPYLTRTSARTGNEGVAPFSHYSLDLKRRKLFGVGGKEIPITAMEFNLLKVFIDHSGRVLTRSQLLKLAHDRDWDPFDRSIDIRVSRLRKKIEVNPTKPQILKTVRGSGYIFLP